MEVYKAGFVNFTSEQLKVAFCHFAFGFGQVLIWNYLELFRTKPDSGNTCSVLFNLM